ncbi:MAG: hypothetical protein ACFFEY_12195 [Candidatus Thorarchaeota archaeon]
MLKRKNIILSGLIINLAFTSLIQFGSFVFEYQSNRNNKLKAKSNLTGDSWNISFDFYGLEMDIDINGCIYVLAAENYYFGLPDNYYGDLILLRYNSSGEQLWKIDLEGLKLDYSKIVVDSKSNLYLASKYVNQTLVPNMLLFKFNSSGDLIWQKVLEDGRYRDIIDLEVDSEDNVYIYGTSYLEEEYKVDIFIAKYNNSGDQQWLYQYGDIEKNFEGWDMEIDSNNNFIISGYEFLLGGDVQHWMRYYNQSGNMKWEISSESGGYFILAVDSSNYVIVGQKSFISKYNVSGNLIWPWQHNIEYYWSIKIALDSSDNVYIGSSISIPSDHHTYDLYVVKINSSGIFDWYLTWGGSGNEDLIAIEFDSNDNFYVLSDNFLIKNPESNGKSLTAENLWNFYIVLFFICFIISLSSLFFILKRKNKERTIDKIDQ